MDTKSVILTPKVTKSLTAAPAQDIFRESLTSKNGNRFEVEGLWKHVYHVQVDQVIAGLCERLQISAEGHGIARDVDDLWRRNPRQQSTDLCANTCSGRVHYDQFWPLSLDHCAA